MNKGNEVSENRPAPANTSHNNAIHEIDLLELWFRVVENWKLILIVTAVFTVGAFVVTTTLITPIFTASVQLYVLSPGDSVINLSDLQIGSSLTKDYQEVFKTWEVNEQVARNLNLDYTYAQLQAMLTVSNPPDTRILKISVDSPKPREAMEIANEFAKVTQEYISYAMAAEKPSVLSAAKLPEDPSSPSKMRNVILGFMLGLIGSGGYVTIRFVLDDKIKTSDDLRKYANLSTLAVVPTNDLAGARAKSAPAGKGTTAQRSAPNRRSVGS